MTLLAIGLWLLTMAMFVASNPSVEMLALSGRFAEATGGAERSDGARFVQLGRGSDADALTQTRPGVARA